MLFGSIAYLQTGMYQLATLVLTVVGIIYFYFMGSGFHYWGYWRTDGTAVLGYEFWVDCINGLGVMGDLILFYHEGHEGTEG